MNYYFYEFMIVTLYLVLANISQNFSKNNTKIQETPKKKMSSSLTRYLNSVLTRSKNDYFA